MRRRAYTRRGALTALAGGAAACSLFAAPGRNVLVVSSSRVPAYEEAAEGLRSAVENSAQLRTVMLDQLGNRESLCVVASMAKAGVVVAVGSAACEAVRVCQSGAAVIATMVLSSSLDATGAARNDATVVLDLPAGMVLQRLKQLYPSRRRIGVIRGPAMGPESVAEIQSAGQRWGYQMELLACAGMKELLEAIPSSPKPFDFLWCLPDAKLYQGPSVPALVLAAMRQHTPLIGFSEGMVRAGAMVGFFPDYRDIGSQAGELAVRRLDGEKQAEMVHPRKIRTAVNGRVSRALGIAVASGKDRGLELVQ